jgi:hypothetical protein
MGYASYYENIVERAVDLAHLAQPIEPKHSAVRVATRAQAAPRLVISPRLKAARTISAAPQTLSSRELHILCLSELRPKPSAHTHAHIW